jgi:hypothetical protein
MSATSSQRWANYALTPGPPFRRDIQGCFQEPSDERVADSGNLTYIKGRSRAPRIVLSRVCMAKVLVVTNVVGTSVANWATGQ